MKMKEKIRSVIDYLFFPNIPVCVYCGREIEEDETGVCTVCGETEDSLRRDPVCTIRNGQREYACFTYDKIIQQMFLNYKFNGRKWLYRFIADRMSQIVQADKDDFDAIVYVPLHEKRQRERGHDQVKLLAERIAQNLRLELQHALIRVRNTERQSTLDAEKRKTNILGAFAPNMQVMEKINGKSILLIDDIAATGSTLRECAGVLKTMGAEKITTLVFAKP